LGDYVVSTLWLSVAVEVFLHVDVAFDDNALCIFTREQRKLLEA
jgi:hypothetical protein